MRNLAFLVLALLTTPALAQDFSDPRALLEALYAGYGPAYDYPPDQAPLRSERLNALYDRDLQQANGELGRIDFDPFVNGQDYAITGLEIGEPYLAGGKAVVRVSFENFGTPNELGVLLVQEDGGWRIDDVWNGDEDYSYDLLDILQGPPP